MKKKCQQVIQKPRPANKRKSVVWEYFATNGAGDTAVCDMCKAEIKVNPDPKKRKSTGFLKP